MSDPQAELDRYGCPQHPPRIRMACPACYAAAPDDGLRGLRAAVVANARAVIGTPFQHEKRQLGGGVDCSGVGVLAYRGAGLKVRDERGYERGIRGDAFVAMFRQRMHELEQIDLALPADLLLLRAGRFVRHSAIVTDVGTLIHASAREGEVVERTIDAEWRGRVVAVMRMPELLVPRE